MNIYNSSYNIYNNIYNIYNNNCNNRNNIGNNDNNSSSHNESFSDLFYKVIHNKYLFNLIFNHIHSRSDSFNQTKFKYIDDNDKKERIKFKDIVSLKFMVENKLFQLLKCKLEANEYIKVDNDGNPKNWLNDLFNQDKQLSIDIVKLLLKSTSISNPDAIFGSIPLLTLKLIQVATDPSSPHSIQVQPDMIKYALINSIPKAKALLDSLYGLNNNNCTLSNQLPSSDYINQFKNTIVRLAIEIKDPFQRDIALELILDNSQYYNIPPSESTNKRIKISQDTTPSSPDINNNNIDSNLDIQLISIQDIVYGIISVDIQNQLLDLNYYYIPESLSAYTDKINNIINNNSISGFQLNYKRSKELLELFRNNGFENENSNQLTNGISSWFYDFEMLQIMVSNNQDDWRGWNVKIEQYINSINLAESEERIKYYHALKKIQEFNHISKYIDNRVSSQSYDNGKKFDLYNIRLTESLRNNDNNSHNNNNNNLNNNNNSSNNNNNSSSQESLDIDSIITRINKFSESCSTMDLYNSLSSLITLQYQPNDITTASNKINFGSIENHIENKQNSMYTFRRHSTQYIVLTCWIRVFIISIKLGSNDRITLLLKHNFNPIVQHHQLFKELWSLKFTPITVCDDFPVFQKVSLGYVQFNTQRFKQSGFTERDPNGMAEIIKALLDNYQQHQQVIIAIQQQHEQQQQQQLQKMETGNRNDVNDQEVEREYIKKKEKETISKLSVPDFVINYLFRMVIQSNGEVQLDTIKSTYKLIKESNIIKVQESTLFSIYYLSLKSKYFIKYIATSPYLVTSIRTNIKFTNVYCLDSTQGITANEIYIDSLTKFDFSKFFDPQVFTFEFVLLNNSFIDILKALVDRYMVNSFKMYSIMEVNHTLLFLLEVRELGLFFHYLEQLKNHNIEFFNEHIQFTLPLFKSLVLTVNQDSLYKLLKEYQPQFKELLNNKYNSYLVFKYYNEINSIIPITETPRDINFIMSHSDVVVKIHALLFGDNKITDYKFGSIDLNDYSSDHYKLLANQYPNNPLFKLSKKSITQLIESSSIIKLKQLYQNQLINDQPSDNEEYDKLLSHLKSQLKQHNINFKFNN